MSTTQTQYVEIAVNGEIRSVPEGSTLMDVLACLGIQAGQVAIEKDLVIVRKADWAATAVQPGAQLEIVQFVGGG